jgi:flagellar protein FliJ
MSTFRFRLQTLWRLRSAERDRRRAELAQAHQAAEILDNQRLQIEAEQAQAQQEARRLVSPGSADIDALLRVHRHELILKAELQQLASQRAQIEAEIQRRRQVLVEADRQVRVVEKLHERKLAEHQKRENRLEVRMLDEVGSIAAARRQEAGP